MDWFTVKFYTTYAIMSTIAVVGLMIWDWPRDNAPRVPPLCIQSHEEVVPAHLVLYVYDLHTAFVGPQVTAHMTPEAREERCDQWIGGF